MAKLRGGGCGTLLHGCKRVWLCAGTRVHVCGVRACGGRACGWEGCLATTVEGKGVVGGGPTREVVVKGGAIARHHLGEQTTFFSFPRQ
jgi:hypothetical protein